MVSHSSPFAFPSLRAILSVQPQLQAALSLCPHCGRRLGRREWATAFNAQQPRAVLVTRSRMCFRAFLKTSSRRMSRSRSKRRRYRVTRRVTRAIISSSRRFFPWCSPPLTTSRSTGQEGTSSSPLSHHRCWHKGRHLSHFQRRPAERKQALPSGRSGHAHSKEVSDAGVAAKSGEFFAIDAGTLRLIRDDPQHTGRDVRVHAAKARIFENLKRL